MTIRGYVLCAALMSVGCATGETPTLPSDPQEFPGIPLDMGTTTITPSDLGPPPPTPDLALARPWTLETLPAGTEMKNYLGVWGTASGVAYVAGSDGTLLKSGKLGWEKETTSGVGLDFTGVCGNGSGGVHVTRTSNSILALDTNGWASQTTTVFASYSLASCWSAVGGETFALGFPGGISYRAGQQWVSMDYATSEILHSVWGADKDDVYIVGNAGTIVHGGASTPFVPETSNTTESLHGVWGSATGDIFAVGLHGTILHKSGSGPWTQQTSNTTLNLIAVGGSSSNEVYAVGNDGLILHTVDQGVTWVADTVGTENLTAVWASDTDVYVTGYGGTLIHR